jgi:hypothetical protein
MLVMVAGALCPMTSVVSAQTATAPELKALYLLNFVKFTEWPQAALAARAPITLCVLNDDDVAGNLTTLVKGRIVDGHALTVSSLSDASSLAGCGLIYASGTDARRSAALLDSLAGKPVLTVGELDKFARLGGVAGFFVEEGTLRFAINLAAAERAGLVLSSKLLSLARLVKDDRQAGHRP